MHRVSRRQVLQSTFVTGAACALPLASACSQDPKSPEEHEYTLGLCTHPKNAAIAAAHKAAFLEISCNRHLMPHKPDADWQEMKTKLLAMPVRARAANSFLPGRLKSTGPKAVHGEILEYAERAFERAKIVGIDTITFGSSGSRTIPDAFPRADAEIQFASLLARLGTLAAKYGVTVSVEPLQKSETNFLNLVSEGARLTRLVDHPHVKITADIFHMMRGDEGPQALADAAPWIHHVHVAEKRKRTAPGEDGQDFRPYFRVLRSSGYRGRISIESGWRALDEQLPKAFRVLRDQLASAG